MSPLVGFAVGFAAGSTVTVGSPVDDEDSAVGPLVGSAVGFAVGSTVGSAVAARPSQGYRTRRTGTRRPAAGRTTGRGTAAAAMAGGRAVGGGRRRGQRLDAVCCTGLSLTPSRATLTERSLGFAKASLEVLYARFVASPAKVACAHVS